MVEVELSVKGWWEESQEQLERRLPPAGASPREQSWLDVQADQEYVLQVALRRLHLGQQKVRVQLGRGVQQVLPGRSPDHLCCLRGSRTAELRLPASPS